jgi:hypothetical protein
MASSSKRLHCPRGVQAWGITVSKNKGRRSKERKETVETATQLNTEVDPRCSEVATSQSRPMLNLHPEIIEFLAEMIVAEIDTAHEVR